MKHLVKIGILLFGAASCSEKKPPIPTHLIYSAQTLAALRDTVEALHEKFSHSKTPTCVAQPQAMAHCIRLDTADIQAVTKDMDRGISFKDFIQKYPKSKITQNVLIVQTITHRQVSRDLKKSENWIEFHSITNYMHVEFKASASKKDLFQKHQWIYNAPLNDYTTEVAAIFLLEDFQTPPLPVQYARLVQYIDILTDSNDIFVPYPNYRSWGSLRITEKVPKINTFLQQMYDFPNEPYRQSSNYANKFELLAAQRKWDSLRYLHIDTLSITNEFKTHLAAAVREALRDTFHHDDLETYMARYGYLKEALWLKRNYSIGDMCGYGSGPRMHRRSIALFAANAQVFPIFLRAHLSILTDSFNYAVISNVYDRNQFNTFIKELEVLKINTLHLLIGGLLHIHNAHPNHCQTNYFEVGGAMAEATLKTQQAFETLSLTMIADTHLDLQNRFNLYKTFVYYNKRLKNDKQINKNATALVAASESLPPKLLEQYLHN